MALQEIWNGTISFSLVAIPVKLVKAVESGRVSFRMLHNKDYSPLARKMYCPKEEKIVPADQMEAPEVKEEEGEGPVDLISVLEESMRKVKEHR